MIYILKGMFTSSHNRCIIEAFGAIQTYGWIITEDDANFNQLQESEQQATVTLKTLILSNVRLNIAQKFQHWKVATRLLRRTFIMRRFFQRHITRMRHVLGMWFDHWVNVPDMDIGEDAMASQIYSEASSPKFAQVFSQFQKSHDSSNLPDTVDRITVINKSRELLNRKILQKWETTAHEHHTKKYNKKAGALQIA